MMVEFHVDAWDLILVLIGVALLALVLPVLIPVAAGGIAGRILSGLSVTEGLAVGFRVGVVGLLIMAALFAVFAALGFSLPWVTNFHGVQDGWRIILLPNLWFSMLCAVIVVWKLRRRRPSHMEPAV